MTTILFSFHWLKHCKISFKPLIINELIKTRMVKWMVIGDEKNYTGTVWEQINALLEVRYIKLLHLNAEIFIFLIVKSRNSF